MNRVAASAASDTAEPRWRPSPLAATLTVLAAAALIGAVLWRRVEFVAFAAPLLGALLSAGRPPDVVHGVGSAGHDGLNGEHGVANAEHDAGSGEHDVANAEHDAGSGEHDVANVGHEVVGVSVSAARDEERCFAGETVDVTVTVAATGCQVERVTVTGDGIDVTELSRTSEHASEPVLPRASETLRVRCQVRASSWGRFAPAVTVSLSAVCGLWSSSVVRHPVRIRVYPRPEPMRVAPRTTELPDRIGAHIGRRLGTGVEFAGIRPYVPGDQLRMVNWHATARRGRLHVTERFAERSATVVALIDALALHDPARGDPPAVRRACSLAVEGAAQLARSALRRGDQAGVIALGGPLRWVRPDIGRRQFYRIADAVLDAIPVPGEPEQAGTGRSDLLPRGILPPSALVVAFTPLLDGRIATILNDVRLRGHAVAVVDVLRELPTRGKTDPLVATMWRWERTTMYRNFGLLGIPVVAWPEDSGVDEALAPLALRPLAVRRPSP